MPSTSVKKLYFAKSMRDLDLLTGIGPEANKRPTKMVANSAGRVFEDAERSHAEHDEEKSYVLYMRFVELVLLIKKRRDFSKDTYKQILEWANIALSKAELLKDSLRKRYSILNASASKENEKSIIITELPKSSKPAEIADVICEVPASKTKDVEKTVITSSELHALLSPTSQTSLIIMDVRSAREFSESHIKHSCCINIPQEILNPGLTAAKLESLLPKESLSLWYKRADVDWIVLADFNSRNVTEESNNLNVLKTAMSKWDQKCLKATPVVLKGGYRDWMAKYPMYTTQVINFDSVDDVKTVPILADLSEIEYPNLDENDIKEQLNENNSDEMLFKKVPVPNLNGISPSMLSGSRKSYSAPAVDRKNKPNVSLQSKPEVKPNKTVSYSSIPEKKIPPPVDRKLKSLVLNPVSDKNSAKNTFDSDDGEIYADKQNRVIVNNKSKHNGEFENTTLHNGLRGGENIRQEETSDKNTKQGFYNSEKDVTALAKLQLDDETDSRKGNGKDSTISSKEQQPTLHESGKSREDQKNGNVTTQIKRDIPNVLPGNSPTSSESKKFDYNGDKPSDVTNPSEYFVPLSRQSSSDSSSKGLVRSHSSPNIAQMVNEDENRQCKIPAIDRSLKPKVTNNTQLSEVNRARQRNLNPVYGNCPVRPATGLRNLGNTCFMNSVIQCLSNTIPLANYIMSGQYVEHINRDNRQNTGGELVEEFAAVIKALWMGQYKSIYPKDFKNTVSRCLAVCIGNEQQDSHEFLVVLMEKLHAELNRKYVKVIPKLDPNCSEASFWQHHKSFNSSKISDIFDGMLKSTLTCLSCGKTSNSFEVSSCLSLPILTSRCSMKDCFKHFLKPEKISGEAAWDCPRCKQKKEAEKRLSICRLPEVLVIQLKRFSYEGLWRRKLQTHVDFEFNFSVPYEENSHEYSRLYSLYGIVNHYGTLEGGHYTAYCKTNSGKWFKYDDHEVSELSSSDIKTSAAYLLFYITSDFQSRL